MDSLILSTRTIIEHTMPGNPGSTAGAVFQIDEPERQPRILASINFVNMLNHQSRRPPRKYFTIVFLCFVSFFYFEFNPLFIYLIWILCFELNLFFYKFKKNILINYPDLFNFPFNEMFVLFLAFVSVKFQFWLFQQKKRIDISQ